MAEQSFRQTATGLKLAVPGLQIQTQTQTQTRYRNHLYQYHEARSASDSPSTSPSISDGNTMPPHDPIVPVHVASPHTSTHAIDVFEPRDNAHLRPEDAVAPTNLPRKPSRLSSQLLRSDTVTASSSALSDARKRRDRRRGTSGSRRRKSAWKKLLWVRQSYPDNYTDEETFLDHLQWNPSLQPYEFWPLVADSTVIVQHLCSVVIFICCFTAIFQDRVSPQTVVGWATVGTVAGWIIRDFWQSKEEARTAEKAKLRQERKGSLVEEDQKKASAAAGETLGADFGMPFKEHSAPLTSRPHSRVPSSSSIAGSVQHTEPPHVSSQHPAPSSVSKSFLSPRMQERLTTVKSAVLIYFSLLGLSPILKSLTMSTSSDSIWALSSWLMGINVFTFDYGAGPEAKFPASLSTNAALMASTVLASRLPSTTHVFSLTLFSIEVFGLFPVFRRHLRHHSWSGHLLLTMFLVTLASGALSMTISGGGWGMGVLGVILGGIATCLSMGLTSWWLIGLQRYKNEIHGPWDPARPIIRRHWE